MLHCELNALFQSVYACGCGGLAFVVVAKVWYLGFGG